jgi:lipoprotein-anchoring transpeptidase ErfK/SrfK
MRLTVVRLFGVLLALGVLLSFAPEAHASASGRWIDVNISTQTATAYEGDTPVYSAGVSTGRPGWETPTGSFSVLRRVANETMDSSTIGVPSGGPGGYYVTNVYYTQYFTSGGAALHANWWSPDYVFGSIPDSHGCVGMRTGDAAWFWDFATIGTPVIVHY